MKKSTIAIALLSLITLFSYGQKIDSTSPHPARPLYIVTTFLEMQTYVPVPMNAVAMTYCFAAGGVAVFHPIKSVAIILGGRFSPNINGGYFLTSRSYCQQNLHGALSIGYQQSSGTRKLFVGIALSKFSYSLGAMQPEKANRAYQAITKAVLDSVPGMRGTYYNALYAVVRLSRSRTMRTSETELNLMVPGKGSSFLYSWQPSGSLMHAIRIKQHESINRFSLKVDIQVPAIAEGATVQYRDLRLNQSTGKVEFGYDCRPIGGKLKLLLGIERGWHAMNFPTILEQKNLDGTWCAPYLGVRFEPNPLIGMRKK